MIKYILFSRYRGLLIIQGRREWIVNLYLGTEYVFTEVAVESSKYRPRWLNPDYNNYTGGYSLHDMAYKIQPI